jgi:cyclic pyranopterin phosphate synthase
VDTNPSSKNDGIPLSVQELSTLVHLLHSELDFTSIRLTGGEPLLYPNLSLFLDLISTLNVPIHITTNGLLLKTFVSKCNIAQIKTINVSLDTLKEDVFFKISKRKGLYKILEGIDFALQLGIRVKINTVVLKGINDADILPLLKYAMSKGIEIRFLELMKMGHLYSERFNDLYFSQDQILKTIGSEFNYIAQKRIQNATATLWNLENGYKFGIIANESEPFCSDCDRLRLDSFGRLYGCLSNSNFIYLSSDMNNTSIQDVLHQSLAQKQTVGFKGSSVSMLDIGG